VSSAAIAKSEIIDSNKRSLVWVGSALGDVVGAPSWGKSCASSRPAGPRRSERVKGAQTQFRHAAAS